MSGIRGCTRVLPDRLLPAIKSNPILACEGPAGQTLKYFIDEGLGQTTSEATQASRGPYQEQGEARMSMRRAKLWT